MLNVQELERKWLRYKIRSYLPYIIVSVSVIALSLFAFLYSSSTEDITKNTIQTQNSTPVVKKQEILKTAKPVKMTVTKEVITVDENKNKNRVMITPSLNFIETLKNMPKERVIPVKKERPKKTLKPTKNSSDVKVVEHKDIPKITYKNTKTVSLEKKKPVHANFSINTKQEEADIQDVIRRFKNNKNPALSLFVAKRFYIIKRYTEAYNYALATNELNSEIEESWIIAAKSLYKLNREQEAVRLLNRFIDDSQSMRARMLLEQIRNGSVQ